MWEEVRNNDDAALLMRTVIRRVVVLLLLLPRKDDENGANTQGWRFYGNEPSKSTTITSSMPPTPRW
jgi:hypothetical protein